MLRRSAANRASMSELPKTFEPGPIEARWYAHWEAKACSGPSGPTPSRGPSSIRRPTSPARSISAMRSTIRFRTSCIRHARMQGKDALWVVGTDHAGIATQMVVERKLEERQDQAHQLQPRRIRRARCGSGRRRAAARSPASCAASAARWTGPTSASRWTRASPAPSSRCSSSSTARPALPRQAPGQLGPQVPVRDQRPRGRDARGPGQILAPQISARRRQRVDLGRDHAARDDARRHGGRGASRRRALRGHGRQAGAAADHRPADPDHRRRACRPRARIGRGQDHARPRLQRFRGRQARRVQAGRDAQHARCGQARVVADAATG